MARCILHIGWHKTGSTSLQMAMHSASSALREVGLHYPSEQHNHGPAIFSAVRRNDTPYFAELFVPPRPNFASRSAKESGRSFLNSAIEGANGADLILSGEDLCLLERDEIEDLKDWISKSFEKIEVVAYLRNHESYLNSVFQQLIRMGFSEPELLENLSRGFRSNEHVRVMSLLPNYKERIERWFSVFGREVVHLYSYDHLVANGQDIVSHFKLKHLKNQEQEDLVPEDCASQNTRFSKLAIRTLSALHEETPLFVDGSPNPAFRFNLQHFFSHMSGPPLSVAPHFRHVLSKSREADCNFLIGILTPSEGESLFRHNLDKQPPIEYDIDGDLVKAVSKTSTAAINNGARAKFFAALMVSKDHPQYKVAQGQMYVVLFLLTDPTLLANCASRLLGKRETSLAKKFIEKARKLGCSAKRIEELSSIASEQSNIMKR